jgi:acyl-CoA synthetase (AMP-forming)/AMP-acid ligase II
MSASNITFELIQQAAVSPSKTALILADAEIDYATLDNIVWRTATLLHDHGIKNGDVTGIFQQNELSRLFITLALMRIGSTGVPLTRSLTDYQIGLISNTTGMKHIVSDRASVENFGPNPIVIHPDDIKNQKNINYQVICKYPSVDCLFVPGSGSTGKQKIIPQSHQILRDRVTLAFACGSSPEQERVLSLTSLEHASGINRLLSVINIGGAFAIIDKPVDFIADYCLDKKITTLFASVFHAEYLLKQHKSESGLLLPGLRSFRISGSSVSMDLRRSIRDRLTPNLHLVYGANECGRISAAFPPEVFDDELSVGHPLPGVQVEITDSRGEILPFGARGQVRIKTSSVIPQYIGDPEATSSHIRDGWFQTGDIGEFSANGSLRIFGRTDGMMILNGINIYPIEIEQAIKNIPGIFDVVGLSIKDEIAQDIPIAIVSTYPDIQISEDQILKQVSRRLGFRSPRKIILLNEIPRNSNGKVQREKLQKLIRSYLDNFS